MGLKRINYRPQMTKYLVSRGSFHQRKVVVVDVGARFGGAKYWDVFGDQVDLIGFEPDEQECRRLNESPSSGNYRYFPLALHRERGAKPFYVARSSGSSGFYERDMTFWSRLSCRENVVVERTLELDAVDFDNFAARHQIEYADFMKVDVEGAELDVLQGSVNYLKRGGVLGVATEVTFVDSEEPPVFGEIDALLRGLGFRLFDIEVSRFTREALTSPEEFDYIGAPSNSGQVIGADALYLRDAVAEFGKSGAESGWTDNSILKLACLFEIFGLPDCAIELLNVAEERNYLVDMDVDCLIDLVTPAFMGKDVTYREYLAKLGRVKELKNRGRKSGVPLADMAREDTKVILGILWNDLKVTGDRWLPSTIKTLITKNLLRGTATN